MTSAKVESICACGLANEPIGTPRVGEAALRPSPRPRARWLGGE
jgi:hypothetical protein